MADEIQVIANTEVKSVEPEKKKIRIGVLFLIISILIFLLAATGVSAYFVAIEKLNIGNEAFKKTVSSVMFSIPFIPKTPKFVLLAAVDAQKMLMKSSFDLSVAATSSNFGELLGVNNMDAQVKGYTDFSETNNPKFSLAASITKDFSAEARKNDRMIYLRISKVPIYVTSMMAMDVDKMNSALQNWVEYDSAPLETEARKNLETISKPTSPLDEGVVKLLNRLLNEQILPKVRLGNDKLDKIPVYKLDFVPDAETLDKIGDELARETKSQIKDKLSDHIKNLRVSIWVDGSQYLLRKGTVSFVFDPGSSDYSYPINMNSPITVSIVLLMNDFGKNIPIEVPNKALIPEEYYQQIMEASNTYKALDPTNMLAKSSNTRRRSDTMSILNAISQYEVDHQGNLPAGISRTDTPISSSGANLCISLVPVYIYQLPHDPSLDDKFNGSDCKLKYDTGYTISKTASGMVTVKAPLAELGEVILFTR